MAYRSQKSESDAWTDSELSALFLIGTEYTTGFEKNALYIGNYRSHS